MPFDCCIDCKVRTPGCRCKEYKEAALIEREKKKFLGAQKKLDYAIREIRENRICQSKRKHTR